MKYVAQCIAIASVTVGPAMAKNDSFARECAVLDLAAIAWIEEQADTKAMPSALLAEAAFTALRARNVCMQGKVAEALALYDSVLTPADDPAVSADATARRNAGHTR